MNVLHQQGDILIRTAELADADQIAEVAAHTYTVTFGDSMTPEDLADVLQTTRSAPVFRQHIRDGSDLLVACMGERIVGYILVVDNMLHTQCCSAGDRCIKSVYVHPDAQGKGIGRALMVASLERPGCKAAKAVYLDVWEENRKAVSLYKSLGFVPAGTVPVMARGVQIGEDMILRKSMETNS
ncbi:MAG: hypothetical protein Alpg2KO_28010 [Alphaproteobacteria bacterium]